MENQEIRIDQALFGYREGHRLLQASRKFVPTTERNLLTLTDMSGPRMVEGFEEYVSGYPVPGEESYAVVKTWYAPEMERPGCVWSHALVVRNEDIGAIVDIYSLVALFQRPEYGDADYLNSYVRPVRPSPFTSRASTPQFSVADAEVILAALYGNEEKPLLIPARDSHFLEDLILRVWSQQWPALRGAFRFCSGSLSSRTLGGQTFDLQVIPQKLVPELRRNPTGYLVQSIPAPEPLPDAEPWLKVGALDLARGGDTFRDFLWRYAEACAGGRHLYGKLSELFLYLSGMDVRLKDSALSEVALRLGEVFPEAKCGRALKLELFGAASGSRLEGSEIEEEARLRQLARTVNWASFDGTDLELRERGRRFWLDHRDRSKAFLLGLLDSPTNTLGDEIVAGCVDALTIPEACEIAKNRHGLLLALVTRNPRLILSIAFWQCPIPVQTYLGVLDFLASHEQSALPATSWIPFLLEVGDDRFANSVVERFPKDVIKAILNRELTSGSGRSFISTGWRVALSTHQPELASFLGQEKYRISNAAMVILAGLLDPQQAQVRNCGLKPWITLAKEMPDAILAFPNGEAASFLLSVAFQNIEPDAVILATTSFEHVHAAARDDAPDPLSYRAWKSLEPDVPVLGYTKNWDHCERLRRALVERFVQRGWPREQFLRCVNRPATLRSIFYSCREVSRGEELIREIASDVLGDCLPATEPQREVFRSSFRRSRRGELVLDL
jgi:hypothetical protein